jgi:hydroxyacylglutathione hydrolase
MWRSLSRLRALPDDVRVFGAHEYTLDNARYAVLLEPENFELQLMVKRAQELRASGKATVPTLLGEEKAANPFLRPDSNVIQRSLKKVGAPLEEVFAAIRFGKDTFDRARRESKTKI